MPRIHMAAEHDDLVFQLGISARYLGDGIIDHPVPVEILRVDVDHHLKLFALLDHADQTVVVLGCKRYLRDYLGLSLFLPWAQPSKRGIRCCRLFLSDRGLLNKYRSSKTAAALADEHRRAFIGGEDNTPCTKLLRLSAGLLFGRNLCIRVESRALDSCRIRGIREFCKILIRLPSTYAAKVRFEVTYWRDQNDLAFELAFVLFETGFVFRIKIDDIGIENANRTRRPGLGIRGQWNGIRR